MKQAVMKKWVRALRSGKFRRGRGALKRKAKNNRYYHCCLGVLCEVYKKDTKDEDIETQDPHYDCATFGDEEALLPEKIRKWAGLKTDDATLFLADNCDLDVARAAGGKASLAMVNDNRSRVTFKKIADIITKRWRKL